MKKKCLDKSKETKADNSAMQVTNMSQKQVVNAPSNTEKASSSTGAVESASSEDDKLGELIHAPARRKCQSRQSEDSKRKNSQ